MSRGRVGKSKPALLSLVGRRHPIPEAAQVEVRRVFGELAEKRSQLEGQWNAFVEGVRIAVGAPKGMMIDKDPATGALFFAESVPPRTAAPATPPPPAATAAAVS